MSAENKIPVKNLPIRLGQFLKLANIVQDGFEAKIRIQNGEVMVNSIVETRRGRKLENLDKVTVDRASWIVDIVE
jgi:ribosome-associated protein